MNESDHVNHTALNLPISIHEEQFVCFLTVLYYSIEQYLMTTNNVSNLHAIEQYSMNIWYTKLWAIV